MFEVGVFCIVLDCLLGISLAINYILWKEWKEAKEMLRRERMNKC